MNEWKEALAVLDMALNAVNHMARNRERAAAERMREACKQVFQRNIDGWNELIGGMPTGQGDSQIYSLQKSIEEAQEWIDEIAALGLDRVLEDRQTTAADAAEGK